MSKNFTPFYKKTSFNLYNKLNQILNKVAQFMLVYNYAVINYWNTQGVSPHRWSNHQN